MKKYNRNKVVAVCANLASSAARQLKIMSLAVALAGSTACSTDDKPINTDNITEVRFTAVDESATRASEKSWDAGDRIGIFMHHSGQKLASGNIINEVSNNIFTAAGGHDVALTPVDGSQRIFYPSDGSRVDFVAYYPYRESTVKHTEGKPVRYIHDIDLRDQSAPHELDFLFSNNAVYKDHNSPSVSLEFEHVLSRLRFNVIAGDGISAEDVAAMRIRISEVVVTAEFSLTEASITELQRGDIELLSLSSGTVHTALMIPSGEGRQGRTLTFTIEQYGTFVWEMPDSAPLLQGKTHNYNVTVTREGIQSVTEGEITGWNGKDDPTVLGEALSTDMYKLFEAPNCYVLSPGSSVTIPLEKVFSLWKNNIYLKDEQVALEGATAKAYIMWKDSPQAEGSILLGSDGIQVEALSASGHGNMVVAYSVDDVVLWSWHIWVTDYDPEDASAQKHNNGYTFLDRNLGATSNVPGDFATTGLYYQWGRKDPMVGATNWGSYTFASMYEADGTPLARSVYSVPSGAEARYLAYSINNPTTYLGTASDWFSYPAGKFHDRWNGGSDFKSPFDPCPEGWRVPKTSNGELSPWYGIALGSMDDYRADYGWDFEDAGFYPQTGYIQFYGTSMQSVGTVNGHYYWSATPVGNTAANCLNFGLAAWNPTASMSYSAGLPVRCIKH